jgi:hypothetical protein
MPGGRQHTFFVTRIGAAGSPERARADEMFEFVVAPAADAVGLDAKRADLEPPVGRITPRIIETLVDSPVVIADLTGRNPNVYYELGIVHALNLPVVLLIDQVGDLPFDVKDESVIAVGDSGPLEAHRARDTREQLQRALETVLDARYRPASVVGEVLGTGRALPPPLQRALRSSMTEIPLYKSEQRFEFSVMEVDESRARIRFALSYVLVNPTRAADRFRASFTPLGEADYVHARTGDMDWDLDDPELRTGRGLALHVRVDGLSEKRVEFAADVTYRARDSETLLTYTPALDYELTLSYPADALRVNVESLLPEKAERTAIAPGRERYRPHGAVLSYQGLRLDWLPTRGAGR